jgi:hypothetical protein
MTTTTAYRPMRNDTRDLDPMGEAWATSWTTPRLTWRELVAVLDRRATWPFQARGGTASRNIHYYPGCPRIGVSSPRAASTSAPSGNPARPCEVRCQLIITRRAERDGTPRLDDWTGTVTLDLRACRTFT